MIGYINNNFFLLDLILVSFLTLPKTIVFKFTFGMVALFGVTAWKFKSPGGIELQVELNERSWLNLNFFGVNTNRIIVS